MRIGYITNDFPPAIGGTETHNYSCVKYLSERGHQVDVIIPTTKLYLRESLGYLKNRTLPAESYTLPELRNVTIHYLFTKRFKGYYEIWRKIKEIEKDSKIDVFDIHHMHYALAFPRKRNVIYSLHFSAPIFPCIYWPEVYKKGFYTLGANSCRSFSRCLQCIGSYPYLKWKITRHHATRVIARYMVKRNYLKELMVRSGISLDQIEVIPFWIDADNILKHAKAQVSVTRIDKKDAVFGFVGRLEEYNGPLLILKAFCQLLKKRKNLKLCIFGDGNFRKELETFVKTHGIESNVIFFGAIPHPELFKYFSLIDYFVFAQWYTNHNWALLEAMSTKKPVIATRTRDIDEVLTDGYNALLAEPTIDSLSEKMEAILDSSELGEKIGENAFKTIQTKHKMENLQKYEELLYHVARE